MLANRWVTFVHILAFSVFWDIRHFAHIAFLLCQTIMLYLCVFMNNQRMFMLINHNPYENIFHLTLKVLPCNWCYRAVGAFCTYCVFTLSNYFFPKNPLTEIFLKNHFYHRIEHDSLVPMQKIQNGQKCHITAFLLCWADFVNLLHMGRRRVGDPESQFSYIFNKS